MAFKALAIDLDGTFLVGEDIPDDNIRAARAARDAGYQIIIATARWRQMALRVADEIGIDTPVIACSGAQVFDPRTGKDVFDERLPEDFTKELFDLCDVNRCIATVTFSDRVLLKLDGEPDMSLVPAEMEWVSELSGAEASLPRIAAIQGRSTIALIRDGLHPKYSDRVHVFDSIGPTGGIIVTITSAKASKGDALARTCAYLDLPPASVVAFGDAENDIEMFKLAGASVAMGQADAETKAAATTVTASNADAGVAQAIDKLLATGRVN